jgi:hypothetical protein
MNSSTVRSTILLVGMLLFFLAEKKLFVSYKLAHFSRQPG